MRWECGSSPATIRDLGVEVSAVLIEVPEVLPGDIGVVRMGEAHREMPGPRIVAARQIVELLRREVGHLVVVFELVGDLGDARAGHRAHVVIPPVDALAGPAVVRGPAEIGRIDIRGQPRLETVELVGPDEMHLARKAGRIAGAAQVMRIGRQVGGEFGGIVVDPRATRAAGRS